MNKELALRTFAYLKTHYQTNDETLIIKEDIEAIDFILNENEQLTNLINKYENKGYDIATERADFLLEIQDLQQELQRKDNIIKSLIGYLETQINDYEEMGYNQSKIREKDLWMAGQYDEDIFILDKLKELKRCK